MSKLSLKDLQCYPRHFSLSSGIELAFLSIDIITFFSPFLTLMLNKIRLFPVSKLSSM